jgi:hypothetical protein
MGFEEEVLPHAGHVIRPFVFFGHRRRHEDELVEIDRRIPLGVDPAESLHKRLAPDG